MMMMMMMLVRVDGRTLHAWAESRDGNQAKQRQRQFAQLITVCLRQPIIGHMIVHRHSLQLHIPRGPQKVSPQLSDVHN